MDAVLSSIETSSRALAQDVASFGACVWNARAGSDDRWNCFLQTDPLVSSSFLCVVFIVYSFVWSILGRNCSKVDQIWSITPWLYSWVFLAHYYFIHNGAIHIRVAVMTVLMTAWGLRLTFNFWRKGGYGNLITHEEDYRWPILRKKMHPILFLIFNLTFIATYQNVLLCWIALPAYYVMQGSASEFNEYDIMVTAMFVLLLIIESVADAQHFRFQEEKHTYSEALRKNHSNKEIRDGFFQSGFFRFSRHPNYFAEQSMWVCVYLFVPIALRTDAAFNASAAGLSLLGVPPAIASLIHLPSILGCIQLILLFQGSMTFSESICLAKYPKYADFQRSTSRCIPWFPAPQTDNMGTKKSN